MTSGGLIGAFQSFTTPSPTVSGSYFDPKTTRQTTGLEQGVEPLPDIFSESTLAMQTQDTYVNWNLWAIDSASNNGLPYLQAIEPMPPTGDMPEVPSNVPSPGYPEHRMLERVEGRDKHIVTILPKGERPEAAG